MPTTDPFGLLEIVGTIAFAVSGGAVAVRAGMDWLGVIGLAVVTAVGGGTLRDLLLGQLPVSWMVHPWPLAVALVTGVLVILIASRRPHLAMDSLSPVLVADAIGLAAFTVGGTQASLIAGQIGVVAVILGVVTGAGGGVIRVAEPELAGGAEAAFGLGEGRAEGACDQRGVVGAGDGDGEGGGGGAVGACPPCSYACADRERRLFAARARRKRANARRCSDGARPSDASGAGALSS